ncbi:MAG: (2Fe-2S)-binding protein [Verrucomicrobia bacterium]|nr:(2Fe-2S)-binding protein [Verrucomicrobiota bacterium]
MKRTITITINGEARNVDVSPSDVLLSVLRDRLGVTSPKEGCGRGDCGSCTILLDGKIVRSCLILAIEADGHDIVTIDGLGKDGATKLQKALIANNAFQCGFCASGIILAATALLEKNPSPSEEEVKEALSGNLCRCTGYQPIIDTILEVSRS